MVGTPWCWCNGGDFCPAKRAACFSSSCWTGGTFTLSGQCWKLTFLWTTDIELETPSSKQSARFTQEVHRLITFWRLHMIFYTIFSAFGGFPSRWCLAMGTSKPNCQGNAAHLLYSSTFRSKQRDQVQWRGPELMGVNSDGFLGGFLTLPMVADVYGVVWKWCSMTRWDKVRNFWCKGFTWWYGQTACGHTQFQVTTLRRKERHVRWVLLLSRHAHMQCN